MLPNGQWLLPRLPAGSYGERRQVRERLGHCLDDRLRFRQVIQDRILVDVGGLAGVFGFVASHANPVNRAQDGAHRCAELCLHGVHDRQVPAGSRGTQSLDLQQCGQGFPDGVIDGRVREVGIAGCQ
jgi:hypothetical protein